MSKKRDHNGNDVLVTDESVVDAHEFDGNLDNPDYRYPILQPIGTDPVYKSTSPALGMSAHNLSALIPC